MLLNDIGKSPNTTFKKINQHLETNYGFKIAEDVSDRDLVAIMEQINDEITDLKIKGDDLKSSPEISKRLLVLEGIKSLREFAMVQFQSPDLEHVVNGLADFVHDSFRLGGTTHQDFEECVNDGMKHYRSSRYRFPDDLIEHRVRQAALSKIHGPSVSDGPTRGAGVPPPVDTAGEHGPMNPVEETPILGEDPWGDVGQRAQARGGHAANVPDTDRARYAMKKLDNPNLSLTATPGAKPAQPAGDPHNRVGSNFAKPAPKRNR